MYRTREVSTYNVIVDNSDILEMSFRHKSVPVLNLMERDILYFLAKCTTYIQTKTKTSQILLLHIYGVINEIYTSFRSQSFFKY